jgi:cellulose synthase/poly-beta-1,6-N-acetylglucosamine synthase-like glycosyltransferase
MITLKIILGLLASFLVVDLFLIVLILMQKRKHRRAAKKTLMARNYILDLYEDKDTRKPSVSNRFLIEAFIDAEEQIVFEEPNRSRIADELFSAKTLKKYGKRLNAWFMTNRKHAINTLALIHEPFTRRALFERFKKEKKESVKLEIARILLNDIDEIAFTSLMESLSNYSLNYQDRLGVLMGNAYDQVEPYLKKWFGSKHYSVNRIIVKFAAFHSNIEYALYLDTLLAEMEKGALDYGEKENASLKQDILSALLDHHPEILMDTWHLNETSQPVRRTAILALAKSPKKASMHTLVNALDKGPLDDVRVQALSRMIYDYRDWLNDLIDRFFEEGEYRKKRLIKVFSHRIDYILLKVETLDREKLDTILRYMIMSELAEPLLDFLNKNEDIRLENRIIESIRKVIRDHPKVINDFAYYGHERILKKLSIESRKQTTTKKDKQPLEIKKIRWVLFWILINIAILPALFIIRNAPFNDWDIIEIIGQYALEVNELLIYYFMVINSIYMFLLILALYHSKRHVEQHKNRKYSELFKRKMLPGISIIAPAYNEELSIIDSVTSLLNLKYPEYEVIVVNDGSKDKTVQTLIDHFELERKHPFFKTPLSTKSLRGVYVSNDIPNLIVVDKANGGKADALNMGVNVSKYPLVCGIDADSVLEDDALLKIASKTLETTTPFLALGGNIYPANGFTFKNGDVASRGLSANHIVRFQTIEYLRAFTSGRIGWSALRSLMIVSGAFGVFKKSDLIESGGYLTSSSVYKKDTVGEDMELVVRLTRQAMEKKKRFRVMYVYNALCYTELPSDMTTLMKQRNRWQRGLVDILSYHRKLALKPRFRQIGFIGYPYFFIFEFMGPFFEAQAYLMLLVALAMGLLTPAIVLGIFTASIGFGVMISLTSILMVEKENFMLSNKETFILILYAILENFGYRQLISLHRVISTFSAIKESGQWGAQKRKGFKTNTK